MAIPFHCGCGQKLSASEDLAGRLVRCPKCEEVVEVPVLELAPTLEIENVDDQEDALRNRPASALASGPAPQPSVPQLAESAVPEAPGRAMFPPSMPELTSWSSPPIDQEGAVADSHAVQTSSLREYFYLALSLALIPLVMSVMTPDKTTVEDRLKVALHTAGPETLNQIRSLEQRANASLDDVLAVLPGDKLDARAHLPRVTRWHWGYAAITAAVFWAFTLLLFPAEKRTAHHLLVVGLFTGTVGIVLLLGFQIAASMTQGIWLRGSGVVVLLFYLVKFVGWSYASANDPGSNLLLSFIGFTCGVGLCEELCKALPILMYYRRDAKMGWRGAALWGLASGAGFGVAEGIMYSSRYYNGISPADAYIVRFISCVALHAIWTASVSITLWRRQLTIRGNPEWAAYGLAILQILAVPMILHGLYDTLLKKDMDIWALAAGAATFAWFALQVEMARGTDAAVKPVARTAWS
ncbi:MAG: PrsW family glutamic-type intramembrane protease [Isosphaeraceae bacterium]